MRPLSAHTLSPAPKWRDNPNKYPAKAKGCKQDDLHSVGFAQLDLYTVIVAHSKIVKNKG